jgi:hypothetical protein
MSLDFCTNSGALPIPERCKKFCELALNPALQGSNSMQQFESKAAPMDWHTLGELMKDLGALLIGAAQFVRAFRKSTKP